MYREVAILKAELLGVVEILGFFCFDYVFIYDHLKKFAYVW